MKWNGKYTIFMMVSSLLLSFNVGDIENKTQFALFYDDEQYFYDFVQSVEYDENDKIKKKVSYTRDKAGMITRKDEDDGDYTTYTYKNGLLIKSKEHGEDWGRTGNRDYLYNSDGLIVEIRSDDAGDYEKYFYNIQKQVIKKEEYDHSTLDEVIEYHYNALGQLVRFEEYSVSGKKYKAWEKKVAYLYDDEQRLSRVNEYKENDSTIDEYRIFEYDQRDRLIMIRFYEEDDGRMEVDKYIRYWYADTK